MFLFITLKRQHIEALKDRNQNNETLMLKENPQFKLDTKLEKSHQQSSKQLAIREMDTPMKQPPLPPPGTPAAKIRSGGVSRFSQSNPFENYGAVIETGTARYNSFVCLG